MKHELRGYQLEAINRMSQARKEGHNHIMVKLPTGAGKTSVASYIINNIYKAGKSALFICDKIELINQTSKRFEADGIDHGVIQADHPKSNWKKKIQVCSIQTLARRKPIDADFIFIDEAHTLYRAHIEIMKANPNIPIIGLSATPFTRGLGKYFSKMVVGATTRQLVDLGFLVEPKVFAPSTPDLEKLRIIKGDYHPTDLEEVCNQPRLIGDIVEHWIKIAFNKPTIVFATSVEHSKAIVNEFKKNQITAEHIDAYTDPVSRKRIINAFKMGALQVLSSVDILSKGFDYPGAEVCILARPTKSLSLYIQQAGRVLRISPETGKTGAIILDHAGNTVRHGFVTDDTPEDLNCGDRVVLKPKEKEDKPKPEPVVCPSCLYVKKYATCENCGFEFAPKNKIVTAEGYLVELSVEIDKKPTNVKELLMMDKKSLYGQLKYYCVKKGWKIGRAFFMYKDITGEEPGVFIKNCKPIETTEQVFKYLQYLAIKSRIKNNKKVDSKV